MRYSHSFKLKSAGPASRTYEADGVTMRLDFLADMLRVALIKDPDSMLPTWSVCPKGTSCPPSGRDKLSVEGLSPCPAVCREEDGMLFFELSGVRFSVELTNFRITAENDKGVLYRDRDGLAYNFAGELGDGSAHYTRREEGQRIYGLGDKGGSVDKSGRSFALWTVDAMGFKAKSSDPLYKHVPFYICENSAGSYGLFYDTHSSGRADLGAEHDNYFEPFNSMRFEEENMVFYLILGTPMQIIRRFVFLTGGIAAVPLWAFSYCGSTMEYTDADDTDARLRGFIKKCEENGIKAGGFYLSSGYTQIGDKRCVFNWNTGKIPSPEGLAGFFKEHGAELIANVKPAFLTGHPMYEKIAENGWFLHYKDGSPAVFPFWGGMASYIDLTHPQAYGFWKECVRTRLADRGYRSIWNDNNEYGIRDKEVLACGFGREIPARLIKPVFSYLMSRASREACEESGAFKNGEIPFMVSRSAIAGTQRTATTWTGDNYTSFEELRYNHLQAMTMALSGFCFFGQDIGGFAGPVPSPELFLRWIQYGIFMPRFVLHSWKPGKPSTMPWLYPELMPVVRKLFALRDELTSYLYGQMERCVRENEPLVRPVFLTEPGYDTEADCFFCGTDILACPVFDEGADSVTVQLPGSESDWKLRAAGSTIKGGTTVTVQCAPEDLPVWFTRA